MRNIAFGLEGIYLDRRSSDKRPIYDFVANVIGKTKHFFPLELTFVPKVFPFFECAASGHEEDDVPITGQLQFRNVLCVPQLVLRPTTFFISSS